MCLFLAIAFLLHGKIIPKGGPLQRGQISRATAFRAFQRHGGDSLRRFATFQALQSHGGDWRTQPELHDPRSEAVAAFADAHLEEVEFHEYLQWEADRQLGLAQESAKRLGMTIGLYRDLAVGTSGGGAEAWSNQDCIVNGAQVGAPPDLLNVKGQDWGLPPFDPARLRRAAYRPLRELVSANMRHGGALRIDHILGFMRLFWIPAGASPQEGAYVTYPWTEMMAVLRLESHRHQCLVIGEDLGTVPEGFSEALNAAGILSTRVFYFERNTGGDFKAPEAYPADALLTVGTHDLPTLAAYWRGADIALRSRLDLWSAPTQAADEAAHRTADRQRLAALLDIDPASETPPTHALYARLNAAPAKLFMVQIEDIIGQVEQVNVPGTWHEYPNWRVRLSETLERILDSTAFAALASALSARDDRACIAAPASAPVPAIPRATYRLQFSDQFGFDDAARFAPYLRRLGISHIYASPWMRARAGSSHGYDVVDHATVNPELGGPEGLENLARVIGRDGIGHILDFVPNHMGIGGSSNAWWQDVLEFGRGAAAASFFDIEWNSSAPHLHNKVLLPILGKHYGDALESGELKLHFDPGTGEIAVWYFRDRLPINPDDYGDLIARAVRRCADPIPQNILRGIAEDYAGLKGARMRPAIRLAAARSLEQRLTQLVANHDAARLALDAAIAEVGGRPETLHRLLERQHYHPAHWAAAADEINYRRFFNVNELAAVRMESPRLFKSAHALIGRMLSEGKLHGLRIDHVDGLYDPLGYCRDLLALADRLQPKNAPPLYLVVEKILARHERLRGDWPVAGTTGYEFISQVSNLLVVADNEAAMTRAYHRFVGSAVDFEALLADSKALVMDTMFRSELRVLARRLHRVAQRHWRSRDYTVDGLRQALRAIVMHFPVYRTYVGEEITADDRRDIDWAVARARKSWCLAGQDVLDFVRDVITGDLARGDGNYPADAVIRFAKRFPQLTAPVMAKSLEDTAFYRYQRLVSLNEVGGDPRLFGASVAAFHHINRERARTLPHAMLATATHDTKRGEDTRARIHVLSEIPQDWSQAARSWAELNARHKTEVDGHPAPDANDEYLIYQTLVGAWPAELDRMREPQALAAFRDRIHAYMTKALREAKQQTSWDNPNEAYEAATLAFIDRLLDPKFGRAFLNRFQPLQRRVARLGMLNSLVQLGLKLTVPGVPDIYQGTELWDFSLVDPDNRRPVDFTARIAVMEGLGAARASALRENWRDGRIKMFVMLRLLALRNQYPDVFTDGAYEPLEVSGPHAEPVCAFMRHTADTRVVVAVARHLGALTPVEATLPPPSAWGETRIALPPDWSGRDVLTGALHGGDVAAAALFAQLPLAVISPRD